MRKADVVFLIIAALVVCLILCCSKNQEVEVLRCPGGIIGLKEDVLELHDNGVLGVAIMECEDTSMPRYRLDQLKRAQRRVKGSSNRK